MDGLRRFLFVVLALICALPAAAQLVVPTVVVKNVTLIDGTGKPPQSNVSILLAAGRIAAIGGNIAVPPKAQVIDGAGKYVIPGLIDTRVQLNSSPANRAFRAEVGAEQRAAWMHAMVGAGVTSARLVQGDLVEQKYLKHWRDLDLLNGPQVLMAGPTLTAKDGSPTEQYGLLAMAVRQREVAEVADEDQAREQSRMVAHSGADAFEVVYDSGPAVAPYPRLSDEALATIVKEAHGHELKVFCWVGHNDEALKAIAAGVDVIEGATEQVLSDDVLAAMAKKEVAFVPALSVQGDLVNLIEPAALKAYVDLPIVKQGLSPIMQKSLEQVTGVIARLREALDQPADVIESNGEPKKEAAEAQKGSAEQKTAQNKPEQDNGGEQKKEKDKGPLIRTLLEQQQERARENVRRAKAAGVRIVVGTGAGTTLVFPGASVHREMQLLTKAGLSPAEAIAAATRNAAASLGNQETGTAERGKRADLVILDGDPLADIGNTTKINTVIRSGRVVDPKNVETY